MEWDAFVRINDIFGFFGHILSYKYICHLFTRSNKNNNKVTGTKISKFIENLILIEFESISQV